MLKFIKLLKIFNIIFALSSFAAMSVGYALTDRYEEDQRKQEKENVKHEHVFETQIVNPTCTEQGYTLYVCLGCGYRYKDDYTAVSDHHYIIVEIVVPTCTEQGYTVYVCEYCNGILIDDEKAALGHAYVESITQPTCTNQGYTTHTCSRCGDTYIDNYTT